MLAAITRSISITAERGYTGASNQSLYGIVIAMYFNDHTPPHFHAKYSGYEALFDFEANVFQGELPGRAVNFVQEWIALHKAELVDNWQRAKTGQPLNYIAPLE